MYTARFLIFLFFLGVIGNLYLVSVPAERKYEKNDTSLQWNNRMNNQKSNSKILRTMTNQLEQSELLLNW